MKVKFTNTQMSVLAHLYFQHELRSAWGPHIPQDEDYKELKILCNRMLKVRDKKLKQGKDVLN